jgi:hypothetical protein
MGPETRVVHGFLYETFSPNALGTRIRARYKIRFTPTITGDYTFTTTATPSTDGGLNITTATDPSPFCTPAGAGGAHGFLRVDPVAANQYSFVWDDGTRYFMWGQTYYQAVNNARFETSPTPAWKTAVDNSNVRKMNKVRILTAPWNVYRDPAGGSPVETQPFCRQPGCFVSSACTPPNCPLDHNQLDLDHWKALDTVVQYLYTKGMVAEIVIFRDGLTGLNGDIKMFGSLDQDQLVLDHVIARYGAYPNVIWSLTNEWQSAQSESGKDASYWNTIGNCVRSGCTSSTGRAIGPDPWVVRSTFKRPLTIHPGAASNQGHCFSFFGQPWPAHASLQEHYSNANCSSFQGDVMGYNSIAANRRSDGNCTPATKTLPVVNDEYGYLGLDPSGAGGCAAQTQDQHRNVIWGLATGGGYGTAGDLRCDCPDATNGCNANSVCSTPPIQSTLWRSSAAWVDIQYLVDFFTSTTRNIPYWTMAPQDAYPDTNRIHTLADSGKNNVVSYFAAGGSASLGLPAGTYKTVWFNPRNGLDNPLTCTVVSGSDPSFSPPDSSDWVLWLRKSGTCP